MTKDFELEQENKSLQSGQDLTGKYVFSPF